MKIGGAFDAAQIRNYNSQGLLLRDVHHTPFTGHDVMLEEDYKIGRNEFGMSVFRDGIWLEKTVQPDHTFDWDYLDRLAKVSNREIILTLAHYEIPSSITYEDFVGGKYAEQIAEVAGKIATRYKNCFRAYVPLNEIGFWAKKLSDWPDWWRWFKDSPPLEWWSAYKILMDSTIAAASEIKNCDPKAKIALCEPSSWSKTFHKSFEDDKFSISRPFHNLGGHHDQVFKEMFKVNSTAEDNLIDIIGLNIYHNLGDTRNWSISDILLETRRQFPSKEIIISETGICHDKKKVFTHQTWYEMVESELEEANKKGARVTTVIQAPFLTINDFDSGEKAPGAMIRWTKQNNQFKRVWDKQISQKILSWNNSAE